MPPRGTERVELVSFGSPRFQSIESGGLLVTHAVFPPGERLCPHVHERTCVATTLRGSFDSGMRGRSHWSRPAMVLTEPAGERHDNTFGSAGAHILIVQPDARRTELLRPFAGLLDSINHFGDPGIALLARRLSREVMQPDEVTPLAIEALGLELLAAAARRFVATSTSSRIPAWLLRVRERLHEGFAEPLTLGELSAIAGVHPGHLARMFRRHFGRSIGAYRRERRLEWAAHRLLDSDDALAAIAAGAGFTDQSHFTRGFRQAFGTAPGAWRTGARPRARFTIRRHR